MHNTRLQAIIQFRKAADQPIRLTPTTDIPMEEKVLAVKLIAEELNELIDAIGIEFNQATSEAIETSEANLIQIADAFGDLQVVVEQLGPTFGLNGEAIFEEVHRSNMSKVDPATGKMPRREDGKAGKGPLFFEPNLAKVITESPIELKDLEPRPDPSIDYIYAPSVQVARRIVPVDFPDVANLDVITPTLRPHAIQGRQIRDIYVLPGALAAPGEKAILEAAQAIQATSSLGGRLIELKY